MSAQSTTSIRSIVPIVTTKLMRETRAFYVDLLGMSVAYDHEHYLGVRAGAEGSPELGFMLPDKDAPDVFNGKGVTYAFRVDDADKEHARLKRAGAAILREPKDEPWGARAFILRDPNGVTLYVSHPIPAALEFQSSVK
ncbi:MAG TPA: VOC family protein [Vicinamibacterales bacterium]|nr:VOC family protein [Vicinamibacterales bacterium]